MQIRILLIGGITSLTAVLGAVGAPMTVDEVLLHVRETCKVTNANIPSEGLVLTGTRLQGGVPAEFKLQFDSNGRFLQTSTGKSKSVLGFDGKTVWGGRGSGAYRSLEMDDWSHNLLDGLILSGMWMNEKSGFTFSQPESSPHFIILTFSHEPSSTIGTVLIEKESWIARGWKFRLDGDERVIKTSGVMESGGMKYPSRIERSSGHGLEDVFDLKSLDKAASSEDEVFAPQIRPPTNLSFDKAKSGVLRVKRVHNGFFLVYPLVNGKELGPFLFDTGAATTILDERAAKKILAKGEGDIPVFGSGGDAHAANVAVSSLAIGNAVFAGEEILSSDLQFLDGLAGEQVSGIIGNNVLWGCVIEISFADGTIELFDPGAYDATRVGNVWSPLFIQSDEPVIQASFEGHDGLFVVDSGADSLSFHSDVVRKLKLLEGRALENGVTTGLGGDAPRRFGHISSIEFGGVRQENIEAAFGLGDQPGRRTSGVIGQSALKPFKVVFDFQHRRIGFVKR